MTAKHDGRHAANNLWVTQQNLARAKGGRPHYEAKPRGPKAPVAAKKVPLRGPAARAPKPVVEASPAADAPTTETP
jgi:hypothetical protein